MPSSASGQAPVPLLLPARGGAAARDPRGAERRRDRDSANSFIFFGKGGELASNRLDEQEVPLHALHLLQFCLVCVNTLMLQRVLAQPAWLARMTPADRRGLTPFVWGHDSSYGVLDFDMERRLDLDLLAAK
ncbi:Tn3 family transposase [Paracraurococcus lichenis]|uniref:Tn3 family transposase n=1 Tax=Paracraurococcus lichenis TaxID=3064888 RepID=A0ABT9E9K7_9PROT|nr:Tn3 family transposase [Paracraurococcus sp. LOR1-02]MDO9712849.1 Tn3 family transposase [Paracraurococcus sp. LOR1-02]